MRKRFISAFLAVVMCLAIALSGCSFVKMLENDLQLVLKVDSEVYAIYNVSIYNNAVVTAPKSKEEGKGFYGWSPQENWQELEQDEVIIVPNGTFITYNDVKDFVPEGSLSVTLYATFFEIPVKDLVIAWYRAEGVSTDTGLKQEHMDALKDNMYTYLETKEYTPSDMNIEIRPYDGNVGNSCGQILSDDDVDIMIGWAGNITSTGGITAKENQSGVSVGTVSRYAARLSDKYLVRLIYVWILNTYGGRELPEPEEIIEEPPVQDEYSIVIAWYNNSSNASGISEDNMKDFKTNLETYMQSQGYTSENFKVGIRSYIGSVSNTCTSVKNDNDVDIMLGWNSTITDNGMTEGTDFIEQVVGITVGTKSRNVALVTDTEISRLVYAWIQSEYGPEPVVTYKVTFNSNGGSDVDEKEVESGKTVQKPDDPSKDGYTFGGWYTDEDCTEGNEYDFSTPVTGVLVLYANWTEGEPEPEPEPLKPTPEDPNVEYDLVIAWYSKSETSGIGEEDAGKFEKEILTYLAGQDGYADKKILLRAYDGNVETSCGNIMTDGDVDIMVGWSTTKNLTGTGKMPAESILANVDKITIGSTARYAARLTNGELCELVFAWIQQNYGPTEA